MIVICTTSIWYYNPTGTEWTDWAPVKDSLYEVIGELCINNILYYRLRECPNPLWVFDSKYFREIDINIQDIECEIVEEAVI